MFKVIISQYVNLTYIDYLFGTLLDLSFEAMNEKPAGAGVYVCVCACACTHTFMCICSHFHVISYASPRRSMPSFQVLGPPS